MQKIKTISIIENDKETFEQYVNDWLEQGYTLSSTSCTYGWYAILVKEMESGK